MWANSENILKVNFQSIYPDIGHKILKYIVNGLAFVDLCFFSYGQTIARFDHFLKKNTYGNRISLVIVNHHLGSKMNCEWVEYLFIWSWEGPNEHESPFIYNSSYCLNGD